MHSIAKEGTIASGKGNTMKINQTFVIPSSVHHNLVRKMVKSDSLLFLLLTANYKNIANKVGSTR